MFLRDTNYVTILLDLFNICFDVKQNLLHKVTKAITNSNFIKKMITYAT